MHTQYWLRENVVQRRNTGADSSAIRIKYSTSAHLKKSRSEPSAIRIGCWISEKKKQWPYTHDINCHLKLNHQQRLRLFLAKIVTGFAVLTHPYSVLCWIHPRFILPSSLSCYFRHLRFASGTARKQACLTYVFCFVFENSELCRLQSCWLLFAVCRFTCRIAADFTRGARWVAAWRM